MPRRGTMHEVARNMNVSQDLSVALIMAGVVAILIGVFANKTLKEVALAWVAAP